ncbi:hypothetical protein SAMN05444955_10337 [Lihuaxuella thermophila]|uniref:Uncharacterized protein n=1 Tax=Lihuaxuella thermophila TaxID=1173111 RepID=A0A1H8C2X3_9BACL|nr:hypothetical protein SAMN05444955_10337 [Lihuaxuella thermophila]
MSLGCVDLIKLFHELVLLNIKLRIRRRVSELNLSYMDLIKLFHDFVASFVGL